MNKIRNIIVGTWQRLDAQHQRWLAVALTIVAAAALIATALWSRSEQARLGQREIEVAKDLHAIQADLADIARLKGRAPPSRLTGQSLQEAVSASLASQQLSLSANALDAGRVRVQGSGSFDAIVRWLAGVQQNHRLAVASFSATRDGSAATVDLVLTSTVE
ncbi:MAG TPA: type II secretion system protein GspM [Rhodocyclaceae bacterium]|nr:type II secretion system protein GspM [Rhodocyclaceae bacterium]